MCKSYLTQSVLLRSKSYFSSLAESHRMDDNCEKSILYTRMILDCQNDDNHKGKSNIFFNVETEVFFFLRWKLIFVNIDPSFHKQVVHQENMSVK